MILPGPTNRQVPGWLAELLDIPVPAEGETVAIGGRPFVRRDGILRASADTSSGQCQTAKAFAYKWQRRDHFESAANRNQVRAWLNERYRPALSWPFLADKAEPPIVLDAGCGAGLSAIEYFGPIKDRIRYLGVDISEAVEVAGERLVQAGFSQTALMQADIGALPLPTGGLDVIFAEGALHHTDCTETALKRLVPLLRHRGRFMFYIYRRKGPVREFTDDLIRDHLRGKTPEEAWKELVPLTRLGKALGELEAEIDIPQPVDLLGIPAGQTTVQRLFYWHFLKAFHRPGMTLEEMTHVNYDWFMPENSHRQSPEQVRRWCGEAGLVIEHEQIEEAGITIVARAERRP